jgi:hypothetical protein
MLHACRTPTTLFLDKRALVTAAGQILAAGMYDDAAPSVDAYNVAAAQLSADVAELLFDCGLLLPLGNETSARRYVAMDSLPLVFWFRYGFCN